MLSKLKIKIALALLRAAYPQAATALHYRSPYELLVAVILAAQCTDVRVNMVTQELYKVANTPEAMLALGRERLTQYIHSCGFFNDKAKHILEASRLLCENFGGQVPCTREELQTLPGVGRKTASVVLAGAFAVPAIAVDTHVFRVSNRIGLAEAATVEKTEQQLMANIPKRDWIDAHHWLIHHGRQVCKSQRPRCDLCTLKGVCEFQSNK